MTDPSIGSEPRAEDLVAPAGDGEATAVDAAQISGLAIFARRLARLSPRTAGLSDDLVLQFEQLDKAVYVAIARTPTPTVDRALRGMSNAANYSRLWMGVAAGLAAFGGRKGRRAALSGLLSVGTASLVANQVVKPVAQRSRPEREDWEVPEHRHVRMPSSRSFPSGHSASAFAFAAGVSYELPLLSAPMYGLATLVAYSRIHTGVHFPGDVAMGVMLGLTTGQTGPLTLSAIERRRIARTGDPRA